MIRSYLGDVLYDAYAGIVRFERKPLVFDLRLSPYEDESGRKAKVEVLFTYTVRNTSEQKHTYTILLRTIEMPHWSQV
jgi:hypothetical protein